MGTLKALYHAPSGAQDPSKAGILSLTNCRNHKLISSRQRSRNSTSNVANLSNFSQGQPTLPTLQSSQFWEVYLSMNIQSHAILFPTSFWKVLVEIKIEVICVLEMKIASVLMEQGGDW